MKKIIAIIAVVVSILLVLFAVSGCKVGQNIAENIAEEAIERAIEKESGENVEIDLEEGEMTIKGEDGEVNISSDDDTVEIKSDEGEATFGSGAELPEGFPGNVPVYPDMELTTSWKSTEGDKDNYSISGLTEDAGDDVFEWYKDKLSGWNIEGEFTMSGDDGKTSTLSAKGDGLTVTIMVIETEDEGTAVVQTVVEE
ncbi:hypothetical protein ACFLQS_01360 [Actinomycetota bacterium]